MAAGARPDVECRPDRRAHTWEAPAVDTRGLCTTPQADEPKSGESVDGPIDRWQRLGQSAPVTFRIPAYEGSPSGN
jgi:hypothetical protein